MPEKPPFDHRLHLLNDDEAHNLNRNHHSGSATNDDEALARALQEEIVEEERRIGQSASRNSYVNSSNYGISSNYGGSPSHQESTTDMELLLRLQQEEASVRSNFGVSSGYTLSRPGPKPPPQPDTSNDMELLMQLQQEEMDSLRNNQGVDDMELARRMQHEEALGQMHSEYEDQVNYARRIQEQALTRNAYRQTRHDYAGNVGAFSVPIPAYGRSTSVGQSTPRGPPAHATRAVTTGAYPMRRTGSNSGSGTPRRSPEHDSDLELARRMQELEERGMGRMNSDRQMGDQTSQEAASTPAAAQTIGWSSEQEEEDARLARMIMESGQSLTELEFTSMSASVVPAPAAQLKPPPPAASPPPPVAQICFPQQPQNRSPIGGSAAGSSRGIIRRQSSSTSPSRDSPSILQAREPTDVLVHEPPSNGKDHKKKTIGSLFKRSIDKGEIAQTPTLKPRKPTIPAPIPPRPEVRTGPLPYSSMGTRELNVPTADRAVQKKKVLPSVRKQPSICAACNKPTTSFLIALDKKYHSECFKCVGCYQAIDSTQPFAYMTESSGSKHPLHRSCYAELYGVKCAVCKKSIPVGPDGKVSFVKHPFFDKEQMCPRHAQNPGRRCTGCHRFEPHGEPFADLNDAGRCVCDSCCRSVVVDSEDAQPLWVGVIDFFENKLHLPIWKDMRKVPILCVGYEALNDQLIATGATHGGSSQIMTRGLCLTEHQSGRKMKLAAMKFNRTNSSFEACDVESRGYTFFQVPDASKVNPNSSVTAIICLSGLPRDLSASVLAHEATHAWIKLHPQFDIGYPIPPQVEEGCAQLVAMLFLTEGLPPASMETYGDSGPSDERLRQYFKFSIETDDHEIYGEGYRKAATAYANIGIEALLSHVVLYKDFPKT